MLWHTEGVYHSNESTSLLKPVLSSSTKTGREVEDTIYHVTKFIKCELTIIRILLNIESWPIYHLAGCTGSPHMLPFFLNRSYFGEKASGTSAVTSLA